MREVFKFKQGSFYGRGVAGDLVKEMMKHPHFKFEVDGDDVVVTLLHLDSIDEEGVGEHRF